MKNPNITDAEQKQLSWAAMDKNYQDYLNGKVKPEFRASSPIHYSSREKGLGYHEDNSPEMRNPSIHKAY